jgi:NifU-like protein involved in Fe-S cluster formation
VIDDIYNAEILRHAGNITRIGRLETPDATATAHSKLCGSTVTVYLTVTDGAVSDFAHEVRACALGQASSAIMAEAIIGSTPADLRELRRTMLAMLKESGAPPAGRFAALRYLEPVREAWKRREVLMRPSEALELHRTAICELIARYPIANPRVFGSAARGEDTEDSDLDIMVRVTGTLSYFDIAKLEDDLGTLAGVRIDIRTEEEFSPRILRRVSRDFRPL